MQYDPFVPIPGVNVTEVETGRQVQTGEDGRFTIEVLGPGSTLRFSHVGFDWDTIKVSELGSYFELYPSSTMLDDVNVDGPKKPSGFPWIALGILGVLGVAIARSGSGKKTGKPQGTIKKVTV